MKLISADDARAALQSYWVEIESTIGTETVEGFNQAIKQAAREGRRSTIVNYSLADEQAKAIRRRLLFNGFEVNLVGRRLEIRW